MKLNHLGYATTDLGKAVEAFIAIGYEKVHEDLKHHVPKNMFVQRVRLGDTIVEFMEPADKGRPSFVSDALAGSDSTFVLHHLCYDVDDIRGTFDRLLAAGEYSVHEAVTSGVFQKNLIGFLRHPHIGLIELFEWPKN